MVVCFARRFRVYDDSLLRHASASGSSGQVVSRCIRAQSQIPSRLSRWLLLWWQSLGVRIRPPVSGAVCPTRTKTCTGVCLDFCRFRIFRGSFFFGSLCFSNIFLGTFAQEAAKGPSLINNFSSAIYRIRARIALLSPPSPSQRQGRHIFHIQFKYLSLIELKTNVSTKQ